MRFKLRPVVMILVLLLLVATTALGYQTITGLGANSKAYLIIPTYEGSYQITHPKVLYIPTPGWNNFQYWMAFTPYPKSNEEFENPSIAVSTDGKRWLIPAGLTNPVVPAPPDVGSGGHNSDPHLVLVNNVMELWYRYNHGSKTNIIYRKTSLDGIHWSSAQTVLQNEDGTQQYLSPAVAYEDNKYKLWWVNGFDNQILYQESVDAANWTTPETVKINFDNGGYAWHIDVIHSDSGYEMLVSNFQPDHFKDDSQVLSYASSSDPKNFGTAFVILKPSSDPSSWDNKEIYRSSLVKNNGYYQIFYAALSRTGQWHVGLTKGYNVKALQGFYDSGSALDLEALREQYLKFRLQHQAVVSVPWLRYRINLP